MHIGRQPRRAGGGLSLHRRARRQDRPRRPRPARPDAAEDAARVLRGRLMVRTKILRTLYDSGIFEWLRELTVAEALNLLPVY